jgi:hypothetical protein
MLQHASFQFFIIVPLQPYSNFFRRYTHLTLRIYFIITLYIEIIHKKHCFQYHYCKILKLGWVLVCKICMFVTCSLFGNVSRLQICNCYDPAALAGSALWVFHLLLLVAIKLSGWGSIASDLHIHEAFVLHSSCVPEKVGIIEKGVNEKRYSHKK